MHCIRWTTKSYKEIVQFNILPYTCKHTPEQFIITFCLVSLQAFPILCVQFYIYNTIVHLLLSWGYITNIHWWIGLVVMCVNTLFECIVTVLLFVKLLINLKKITKLLDCQEIEVAHSLTRCRHILKDIKSMAKYDFRSTRNISLQVIFLKKVLFVLYAT